MILLYIYVFSLLITAVFIEKSRRWSKTQPTPIDYLIIFLPPLNTYFAFRVIVITIKHACLWLLSRMLFGKNKKANDK